MLTIGKGLLLMCRCQSDDDYCDDWRPMMGDTDRLSVALRLARAAALMTALAVFWVGIAHLLLGCAGWSSLGADQKHQAKVGYYRVFSAGLKSTVALVAPEQAALANAAISIADSAIDRLDELYKANASKTAQDSVQLEVQAKIESANAVVGVTDAG